MYEKNYQTRVLKTDPAKVEKKRRRFSWKKFFFMLGILLLLAGTGYALTYPAFQISQIDVVGTTVLDTVDIQMHISDQMEGKWLWLFPKTSIFLINEKSIEHSLQKEFSRIETVSVVRTTFHSITVSIQEYAPVYVWCGNAQDERCYFMDKRGMVYSEAPVFSGTAYPKIVVSFASLALPFQAMSLAEVGRVSQLETKLSAINIIPSTFRYVSDREIDIDFLHNKSTAVIKIDPSIETDTSLEYIFSGIRTEPLASLFRNDNKKLEYIDVRFPSKVVYKFEE